MNTNHIKLALSKLSQPVLNAVLVNHGFAVEANKTNAITLIEDLINNGKVTLSQVQSTQATAVNSVATSANVPDDIRKKLLSAQAEVANAVAEVERVREVANRLLDDNLKQQNANDKKFNELTTRLNNELNAVQGVDYNKVESAIASSVAKSFSAFRKVTPKEELVTIASALPVCERKLVKDVFTGQQLSYEHKGEVIDFSNNLIDVWNDSSAPARVDDYVFNAEHLHQTLCALDGSLPDNVWLAGERGTGKTEFVTQVASRLGRRLFKVSFDESIERTEFIGGNTILNGNVVWKEGIITQAIQHTGAIVLLDEIGFARAQNLAVLHAVTEPSPHRALVISETGVRIPVASHVVFFCADNSNGHGDATGNFAGVRDQNTAFIDRFSYTLEFEYLPHDAEVALLCTRTGIPHDASNVLVTFANTAREKARAGLLTQPPSLRQLFAWARAIQKGVPVSIAFENAIVNKFPADCEAELRGVFSATIDVGSLKSFLVKK